MATKSPSGKSMKRYQVIGAACAGLAAGAWTGWHPKVHPSPPASPNAILAMPAATAPSSNDALSPSSIAGWNPTAQKLFSALRDPIELRRKAKTFEIVQSLRADEIPALIAAAEKLPVELQISVLNTLFERWAKLDSQAVRKWILEGDRFTGWICLTWAKVDRKSALDAAFDPAFARFAESLLSGAADQLTREEIPGFWSRLKTLPPPLRARAMRDAFDQFDKSSPLELLTMAADLPDPADRLECKTSALVEWAKRDPREAMARLTEMLPEFKAGILGNSTVTDMVATLAATDSAKAMEFVSALPPEYRATAGIAAACAKAQTDPAAALEWCLANGVEPTRGNRSGFNGWSASVLGTAISKEPQKTFAWVTALPAGPQRDQFMERALEDSLWLSSGTAKFNREFPVVDRLFAELPPDAQERVSVSVGKAWGGISTDANLAERAKDYAEGTIRQNVISGALRGAFEEDAALAERMLASLTVQSDRDAALQGLCSSMREDHPALAADRALGISNQNMRKETLDKVIIGWLKREPARSREWLEKDGANLPAAWKSAWLK